MTEGKPNVRQAERKALGGPNNAILAPVRTPRVHDAARRDGGCEAACEQADTPRRPVAGQNALGARHPRWTRGTK